MGRYIRVGTHHGRPLYRAGAGANASYIYFWAASKRWQFGDDYTHEPGDGPFFPPISSTEGGGELDAHLVPAGRWFEVVRGSAKQNQAITVSCTAWVAIGAGQRFVKEAGAACGSSNNIGSCGHFSFSREALEEACLADVNCVAYSTWGYEGGLWCMKSKYTPGDRNEGHDCYVKQGRVPAHAHAHAHPPVPTARPPYSAAPGGRT